MLQFSIDAVKAEAFNPKTLFLFGWVPHACSLMQTWLLQLAGPPPGAAAAMAAHPAGRQLWRQTHHTLFCVLHASTLFVA